MENSNEEMSPEEKRIERSAYKWNTAGGMLEAFQSVIILMVLARVCDVAVAGVFTLAYANGNLFLNLGKYGMHSFQASDRPARYSFGDYHATRILTTAAMIVLGSAYLAYLAVTNGYTSEKTAIIEVMCLYMAVTAFEDVYHGNFQQHGRLDVAARFYTIRIGTSIAVLCIAVLTTRSLLSGEIVATVYTALFVVAELVVVRRRYALPASDGEFARRNILKLLKTCFPLFAAAFLLFYIGNAPRYAIDALMDDSAQAYYGYIAMPVFVVSLLASFVYYPMITSLTDQWGTGQRGVFIMRFAKVAAVIVGLTAVCDAGALLVGVPVLDLLYKADTAPYLGDLVVLVTGGGFLSLATFAVLGITIMRFQRVLVPVYGLASIGIWFLSGYAVSLWGIDGACWSYLLVMAGLAASLIALFLIGTRVCYVHD